jgi:hypothetical protein
MEGSSEFTLKIKEAAYEECGSWHPVKIEHLVFKNNGDVFMNGSDDVGTFRIDGELENNLIKFSKKYSTHTIYYVGYYDGKHLNLVYDRSPNWESMASYVHSQKMAFIEFDSEEYTVENKEEEKFNLLMQKEVDDDKKGKYYGILLRNNDFVAVEIKVKEGGKCKVEMFTKGRKEEYKGKFDEDKKIFKIKDIK